MKKTKIIKAKYFLLIAIFLLITAALIIMTLTVHKEKIQTNISKEETTELIQDIYEEAARADTSDSLEAVRNIVNRLGENGYVAVDSKNQIDMTEPEQVIQFCERADAAEEAKLTILVISYEGFTKYDLHTQNGDVNVDRTNYSYENGRLTSLNTVSYHADLWTYTEDGYLLFAGKWFFDEYYLYALSGVPEQAALRVRPLDERCRELNRLYILPIGYRQNNMFLSDWNEQDFGELDFYDIFDIFYPVVKGCASPYVMDDNLAVSAVYHIPKDEFESVVMPYFQIDDSLLRQKTTYISELAAYRYSPRGFDETEYPEMPYPEVISYTENKDGTITLTVHAVYPDANTSKAFAHQVVVRPLNGGGMQYVSNRVIPSKENLEMSWHVPRLGGTPDEATRLEEDTLWFLPQAAECLITDAEKEELQKTALLAAGQYGEMNLHLQEAGWIGLTVKEKDGYYINSEVLEAFYADYQKGEDAMVSVMQPEADGLLGMMTFIYRNNRLQIYYIGIDWKQGDRPEIKNTLVSDVAEIKMTEKGYFIYTYAENVLHASLREYWRINPHSSDCAELTEKYISGLGYTGYRMLVTDWDENSAGEMLMPCMFEDIYRTYTGENLEPENGRIPADIYEQIMTTYFPVSDKQVQEKCGYDENSNSYPYEAVSVNPYPPFGEVVDYTENADGTLTLIVDAVWPDYNSDRAFTNTIVVKPFKDGTFQYLSNSVEEKELSLPPIAGMGR